MMSTLPMTHFKTLAACIAAACIAGCAGLSPAKPEDAVRQRATARWQALIGGNVEQAYGLLAHSYRAVTPLSRYKGSFGGAVTWVSADVFKVDCEPEKCTARVRIDFQHPLAAKVGGVLSTHIDEIWLLEGNQWWLFQKL